VNNTWLALAAGAVAASVALGRRLGLDVGTLIDALQGSPLVSPWQAAKLAPISRGDYSAQSALSLALKDVHLALQADASDSLPVPACVADEGQQAADSGLGDEDLTVVTRLLEH
jgi:3-hydroxyisobutyrate dehydrogenase